MKYITVSIGNTDNRLSQVEWHEFVTEMDAAIGAKGKIHFFGDSPNWMPWQNVAWIVEIKPENVEGLLANIKDVRAKYLQDSAFVMLADGMFV